VRALAVSALAKSRALGRLWISCSWTATGSKPEAADPARGFSALDFTHLAILGTLIDCVVTKRASTHNTATAGGADGSRESARLDGICYDHVNVNRK